MNPVEQEQPGPAGDAVDALLTAFFRREMPDPWPAFRPPESRTAPPPRRVPARWARFASRMGLAASVGLLVLAATLLPGRFVDPVRGFQVGPLPPGTSTPKGLYPVVPPDPGSATKGGQDRVKSSLFLEQDKDGPTGIRVNVEGNPSDR